MEKETKTNKENKKKDRYNEKDILKKFLLDPNIGFENLKQSFSKINEKDDIYFQDNTQIFQEIDIIIDLYAHWINKLPLKGVYYGSSYDGLKILEKGCENAEIRDLFKHFLL